MLKPRNEWTVMFYFASDNPLASTIVSQLKAIKDAGFHPEANVIAQFDPHTVNMPAHTFDVNKVNKLRAPGRSEVGFIANDPYVRNLVLDKLWGEREESIRERIKKYLEDGAEKTVSVVETDEFISERKPKIVYDPPRPPAYMSAEQNPKEALSSFLSFCREFYPARHYVLFILGHGLVVGNDFFLFDEHAAQHSLRLTELGEVLRTFKCDIEEDEQPGQLELIGFHSCSMSSLEVAYELKNSAKFMLASQGPAFVGSWPYRQILIRVFNDLNSCRLKPRDLNSPEGLADRLKAKADKDWVSGYLLSKFNDETTALLNLYDNSKPLEPSLLNALVQELNAALEDTELPLTDQFQQIMSDETRELFSQRPLGTDAKWLNRMLLTDAYPEINKKQKPSVRGMAEKIYYYCLYNSYDYQLAGYSFDLCLCDMSRVSEITEPLATLSANLTKGLADSEAKGLILLAHWDSQSFWQETYTDLYDFCFCLKARCEGIYPTSQSMPAPLKDIHDACEVIMIVLKRGSAQVTDKLIVRSAFAGPAYQYSHGLSVFFPWAEPVDSKLWDEQYEQYKLNKKTSWRDFLQEYFKETRRQTRVAEADPNDLPSPSSLSDELLALLQDISARVFNDEGQLTVKHGPNDPMGKYGPNDPAGNDCDCPSIKNYPPFTRPWETASKSPDKDSSEGLGLLRNLPVSPNFFERFELD